MTREARVVVTSAGPHRLDIENAEAATEPRLPGSLQPSIILDPLQQLVIRVVVGGCPKSGGRHRRLGRGQGRQLLFGKRELDYAALGAGFCVSLPEY